MKMILNQNSVKSGKVRVRRVYFHREDKQKERDFISGCFVGGKKCRK